MGETTGNRAEMTGIGSQTETETVRVIGVAAHAEMNILDGTLATDAGMTNAGDHHRPEIKR